MTRDGMWAAGTPCWVEAAVRHPLRSQEFYTALFGWEFTPWAGSATGRAIGWTAGSAGRTVAGLTPATTAGRWTVFVATDDLTGVDAAARAAGGQLVRAAEPSPAGGRRVLWRDPTGAVFGVWQGDAPFGFAVTNEAGAPSWCDLMSVDVARAKDFYAAVFGYAYSDIGMGDAAYALFTVPGETMPGGGIGEAGDGEPSAWSVCFEVADVDASVPIVRRLGGRVTREPYDFEYGRLAHIAGPDGESFTIVTPTTEDEG